MICWLLDTNVISETRKPRPARKVLSWLESLELEDFCTSTIVLSELRYGALQNQNPVYQAAISTWIETSVRHWFEGRVYEVDEDVLLNWGVLMRRQQKLRKSAPPVDLMIAALASTFNLGVATRDVAPFVASGVPALNPWTGESFNNT